MQGRFFDRRAFLRSGGSALALGALSACARGPVRLAADTARVDPLPPIAPIRASVDRIIAMTVSTRPFREQGPRIEAEKIGRQTVVHHYGHGGSGWSLSWGSAQLAVREALAMNVPEIAVIGCGAIGLTSALVAQRAGLKVTIYAKERPPDVRSSLATGVWSPDSRYCTAAALTPDGVARWEAMARASFRRYQTLLGLPGLPVEWRDGYALFGTPFTHGSGEGDDEPEYAHLVPLIRSLWPRAQPLPRGAHPFAAERVMRYTNMVFNISALTQQLMAEFHANGGRIETMEFASPSDFARLREKTLINATGYGARALLGDESVIPVRGQLARLIPQPEVDYGISCGQLHVVPRRDGIIVQTGARGDYNNPDTTPNPAESEAGVTQLAQIMAALRSR